MANYAKTHIGNESRVELHEVLGLTGAEVSVNNLPAGAGVPFVHAHKENEEIYGVLEGAGSVTIDGEEIELAAGDWLRISPAAHRQFRAASDSGITYVCIQVKQGPLMPSQPTTLSCSNSRSVCKGPMKPRPLAPCTNLLTQNCLTSRPASRKRGGGTLCRFRE